MNQGNATNFSPSRTTSWRGRFIDGVWHCDCEPRLPADHFQTKKAGINHGRWFYTCQKPQPQRCKFFLWDDDAQPREKQAVLANSRSEPDTPQSSVCNGRVEFTPASTRMRSEVNGTPTKRGSTFRGRTQIAGGLATPSTERVTPVHVRNRDITQTPTKIRRTREYSSDEDTYSWDESLDNEVNNLMGGSGGGGGGGSSSSNNNNNSRRLRQPVFTPIMAPGRTPPMMTETSPNKRKREDTDDQPPPYSEIDPTTSFESSTTATTSPVPSVEVSATPTPRRYMDVLTAQGSSSGVTGLSSSVLSILDRHDVIIPTGARDDVAVFLEQQHLKTQGIIRGRDMSRVALKKKDEEIKSLKERIENLEMEREMDKIVISCLKSGKGS